jgi:hypothetical protein
MICVFYAQTVWPSTLPHTNGLACNFYAQTVWPPTKLATHQRVDFAKKMNPTMVEPLAAPLATWLLRLRPNPRRPMFAMGWSRALSKHFI